MERQNHEQNDVRRYLLKQLSASERKSVELRLLSDDAFAEEVEIVEDELIDEYLANELSRKERRQFAETFLATPERQQKIKAAEAVNRYFGRSSPQPKPAPNWFETLRRWLISLSLPVGVPVGVAAVIVLGVLMSRGFFFQSDVQKGLVALNDAYREARPVESRISNLDHAPFIVTRGNEAERVNTLERERARLLLSNAVSKRANADSYHGLGKFYLYQRDPDNAIQYLEQARQADGKDAQILADLGAAYFEKGKRELEAASSDTSNANGGKGLEDLGRSLEYLNQALELNPNLLEALFNRGLVHQSQGLDQQAEADWRSYLQKDPNSEWAKEVQQKLKLLEEKKQSSQKADDSTEAFLQAYRAHDDERAWEHYRRSHGANANQITTALVDRVLAKNSNAAESLEALNYLGQLENRKTNDSFTSDLARVYASASPQRLSMLLEARQRINDGSKLFGQSKVGEGIEVLTEARQAFEKLNDVPELLAAELAIASGATSQPDLPRAQEMLSRIIPSSEAKHYKWLLAICLSKRTQINSNLNNYSKAFDDSTRSLQLFQESQDTANALGQLLQIAVLHLFLNDNETSLTYLQQALALRNNAAMAQADLWGIQLSISLNLTALKLYRAALDYQNEALQLALSTRMPLLISRSYQYIGLTYGSLQRFDLALQNLQQAYDQGKPLSTERSGQNMMANASLKLGDLYRTSGDPTRALAAYDESSRLYEALGFAHYNYAAHKGKFLSYVALQNDGMASQELLTVVSLFDEYREKIVSERQTAFFFDREQDTYDLAIDFVYSRLGDSQRAFNYSEISRARSLTELMQHGAEVTESSIGLDLKSSGNNGTRSTSLSLVDIQQRLPARVQLIQYAVLEKKLLIWVITRDGLFSTAVDVEAAKLDQAIASTLKQLNQRDDTAASASLKNLYRLVIAPIRERLDSNKVVCLVPDKSLHYLPFGALLSDSSGRYLLQDFQLMESPSATFLIESSENAQRRAPLKEEHLLAVGNPSFDRSSNPELANLPGAEREVKQLAQSYSPRRILIRRDATRQSITDEIARADVAHFAAHYEIDPRSSLSSRLILGPEAGNYAHAQPSGLSAADIYRMKLTRTRLVVLSGCKTGIEQQFAGEGPIGFARSFLVAGVPVVVASLWPVDSDATAELMIAFHRFRKAQNLPTTTALMRAQQELMNHDSYRSPYYWAGFTVVGGYADF